jgi:hypothetical protein
MDEIVPQTLCAITNGNPPDNVGSDPTPATIKIPPNKKQKHPIK